MLLDDFNKKYGFSQSAIHVAINQNVCPQSVLYRPKNEHWWHIDEEFFLKRVRFRNKVVMYCQDMYYLFTYSGITKEHKLAQYAGISQPWFSAQLFKSEDNSVMRYKIPKKMWQWFRFCRRVERILSRRYNIRFDIEKVLDTEAKIWQRREEQIYQSELLRLSQLVSQKETLCLLKTG